MGRDFSFLQNILTGPTAHPFAYRLGTLSSVPQKYDGQSFKLIKQFSGKFRMSGTIPPLPLYAFVACIWATLPLQR